MFISIQLNTIPIVNLQIRVSLLLVQTSDWFLAGASKNHKSVPLVVSKENDEMAAEASPIVQPGFLAY